MGDLGKTLVIGGTGHIGTFLTRLLVEAGYEVDVMTSGHQPPPEGDIYRQVKYFTLSYADGLADGSFLAWLREERPRVVVDILAGDLGAVWEAARQAGVAQVVACGSVWMWGRPKVVPTPESPQTPCPFEGYAQRLAELFQTLERSRAVGPSLSAIMPPNICGPGKIPLEASGGRSLQVHQAHRRGETVILPAPGTNLIGPCDAEDVARGFLCAIQHPEQAAGEIFNVGSAYALTSERFVGAYAELYGTSIPIDYVSPEVYAREVSPELGSNFHFLEHMCPDITKVSTRLSYHPLYTPEQTLERAVRWMFDTGVLPR
jgi:nucleoside-diphosphate-sugar epimerase